ncbi:MAG TPA: SufD family Fe-S cluster assembly protein, partial [Pyrinomonadaceae bacterium]|nr:SufD family Fe-S cluster assembly protein [Pyrinomonadaceae bacterium]
MALQLIKEQSRYAAFFDESERRNEHPDFARRRREAFAQFEELGFPTIDLEDWKYTNISALSKTDFAPAEKLDLPSAVDRETVARFADAETTRLIFVNGFYRPELSDLSALPTGVIVDDLLTALSGENGQFVREKCGRLSDGGDDALAAFNTAFSEGGAYVFVPRGVTIERPISVLFLSEAANSAPMFSNPRVLVVAERESSVTVIENYRGGEGPGVYWTNAVVELFVEEAARVTYYKVQRESEDAYHTAATRAHLTRSAALDMTTITLGAKISRHDIVVRMDHEGAECWVDGLYLVGDGQHADTHSLIDHVSPHCTSHQLYKGILDGKSRAVFNGKVFVHRNARGSDAQQTNKNLLLSREARVDT